MLLDTSGLFCLADEDEPGHDEALELFQTAKRRIIHGYVLAEWVALAHTRKFPRQRALDLHSELLANPRVEKIWVDEATHRAAFALLEVRPDKSYSLCDAVSFVLMRSIGVHEALTTDKHFVQEGFRRLID